ncbi:TetR/AcrR family transcriptional regulator [Mesonia sp. HuA40]|uniref:TetR/AcrR family transcriptional regulator n=1 Tax=Mesonia sp. HuA40 TaxID=2602761 RepID=UPI0011C7EBA6|nr:TetR/AcrR family transcriptional regulator [Mesonia sp. HuA40]TXK71511.1 TetR/AcrR family transcriptional regulator [Mesonia sp. HuA40]
MKEKILKTATDLFLSFGFKNVTMDVIAQNLGISKKTIYTYYTNKNELVSSCTQYLFYQISQGVNTILEQNLNAIDEMIAIHQFIINSLREEKASIQYQLNRYYPSVYKSLKEKKSEKMLVVIQKNLEKGMEAGYYREDLNPKIVAEFYRTLIEGIRNNENLLIDHLSINTIINNFLDYHLRAIVSPLGLKHLKSLKTSNS